MTAVIFHYLDPQSRAAAVGGARQTIASLGSSDFIAMYALEEVLVELAPFTNDVSVLTAALNAVAVTPSTNTMIGSGVAEAAVSLDSTAPGGAEAAANSRARMHERSSAG